MNVSLVLILVVGAAFVHFLTRSWLSVLIYLLVMGVASLFFLSRKTQTSKGFLRSLSVAVVTSFVSYALLTMPGLLILGLNEPIIQMVYGEAVLAEAREQMENLALIISLLWPFSFPLSYLLYKHFFDLERWYSKGFVMAVFSALWGMLLVLVLCWPLQPYAS
jgi:hypothetical protein